MHSEQQWKLVVSTTLSLGLSSHAAHYLGAGHQWCPVQCDLSLEGNNGSGNRRLAE